MLQSSSSKKNVGKTSCRLLFWAQFAQKRGHYGSRPKWEKNFLVEIIKADHQLSETFYFIKISYVLTELWIFFLSWVMFSVKKVLFPAKTPVTIMSFFGAPVTQNPLLCCLFLFCPSIKIFFSFFYAPFHSV